MAATAASPDVQGSLIILCCDCYIRVIAIWDKEVTELPLTFENRSEYRTNVHGVGLW